MFAPVFVMPLGAAPPPPNKPPTALAPSPTSDPTLFSNPTLSAKYNAPRPPAILPAP